MATGGQINTDNFSDEILDVLHVCSKCKNQGINIEADKFCVDCHDYFCVNCVKIHSKVPSWAGHKVLDRSQVKSGTSKGLLLAPAERHDRHSHKYIEIYSRNHDEVGRPKCMADDHRSFKDTFYIPKFIKNNTDQRTSRDSQSKLNTITKTLEEQASKLKQDKQWLLKRKEELLADIKKFRQEINDQLDKLEKNSVDEIEEKVKCLERKIEDGLKQLQAHKAKVTSAYAKLAFQNTNQAEVFVNVKMAEDAANVANKFMEDIKKKSTVQDIKLQPDMTILRQLEQSIALGVLTEYPSKKACTLFQIQREQSYCIKDQQSDKKDCYITSACCLEDGPIMLADCNNKKLKQIHSYDYTVTDHCDLPGQPWQVCAINETDVALTLPYQNQVHFISVEGKMKTTNKINTGFECFGLAHTNNNLYISDSNTSVYIYTLTGSKLKQFSMTNSGQKQFSFISSLAVSKDGARIYVTDYHNGLIVLDNNGLVVTTYHGEQLPGANCCYITEADSVLVSGESSKNVLQFTPDGKRIGEVIKADRRKSGIKSVCCNQQMSKMFVCRHCDNNIEVYDIKPLN